jgi:predicted ATPase
MKYGPFLKSFRLENFKAVQKSGLVRFTPLTVLIGNNGSGKSSLIEGLETYRSIVLDGLDEAMSRWFDLQHVWNKHARHELVAGGVANETYTNPMRFEVSGAVREGAYRTTMLVNATPGLNSAVIQEEAVYQPNGAELFRDRNGACLTRQGDLTGKLRLRRDSSESAVVPVIRDSIKRWQFLSMMPDPMGKPMAKPIMMSSDATMLQKDGSNLVEYLLHIRAKDIAAFEGIIDSMRFVLPYAKDFQPVVTRELRPTLYLKMFETAQKGAVEIPGWLLSTGTLRILGLLAVLRNPDPPPLIVIEEIENGLDPRTIHMILDEIRMVVQAGLSQVIITTHSPYLLDLLPLQTLVLVQRENGGEPTFWRPSDSSDVQKWATNFAPGQLYTAGRFQRGGKA